VSKVRPSKCRKFTPNGDFQARGAWIMKMIGSLFSEPMRPEADSEHFGGQQP